MRRQHSPFGTPWAARHQGDVVPGDIRMTELARLRHPAARWWWGWRADARGSGAYCYLCDRYVSTWAHNWPMPLRAVAEVVEHRDQHLGAAPSPIGTPASGAVPDAAAPKGEVR